MADFFSQLSLLIVQEPLGQLSIELIYADCMVLREGRAGVAGRGRAQDNPAIIGSANVLLSKNETYQPQRHGLESK